MLNKLVNLDIWDTGVLSNTLGDFAVALTALVGFLIIFKVFQVVILRRLKRLAERTETDIDDTFIQIVKSIKPPFYTFLAFYFAVQLLTIHPVISQIISIVLIGWVIYQIVVALQVLIDYILKKTSAKEDRSTAAAIELLGKILKGALWVVGVLLALSNLGVNVTSLIAGLGIGGIAIALAAQNVLGDLFSSFVIYFDKPFVTGDFIVVGDKMGVVERIGIKTTRIRSLQGEEIVMSNQELTSTKIQNFKKMQKRRVVFQFGVEYSTPQEKFETIPKTIKEIINGIKGVEFDRAHFIEFNDSSLDFEVVYYVGSPDYNDYRDLNQEILFGIRKRFEKEGVAMAFPTRTVYLQK